MKKTGKHLKEKSPKIDSKIMIILVVILIIVLIGIFIYIGIKNHYNNMEVAENEKNENQEIEESIETSRAEEIIVEETDPAYVNFEFDSYWMTDAGVNVPELMEKMGNRIKLWHINDRGCKKTGPYYTPILKEDATELGYGNMDLETLMEIAIENGVEGVILETHQNWINDDPIESIKVSSEFMKKHFRQ